MKKDILGYVVLKKIHENQKNLLDAYMPFVEYIIFSDSKQYFDISEIRQNIASLCGLDIPLNTIKTLLKRLRKDGLIEPMESYNYIQVINTKNIESYKELFSHCERDKNKFFHEMINFLEIEILEAILQESFIKFIFDTIEMINPITYIDTETNEIINKEYLLFFRFIDHISKYDNELYEIFKNIYYGALLSRVTDVGAIDTDRSMENITVILDTDILFRILGFQNPILCEATAELMSLIKKKNMKCRCLTVSVNEMRSVLLHRLNWINEGKIPREVNEKESEYMDGIVGAIYRKNLSTSDIEDLIQSLELNIEKFGIQVDYHDCLEEIDNKDLIKEYYEKKLIKFIKNKKVDDYDTAIDIDIALNKDDIPDFIQNTVLKKSQNDLKMISYVRKSRKNKIYNFKDINMLILTGDRQMARYSLHKDDSLILPEVFLEETFTNNLWLCDPQKNDNLSIDLILSTYNASSYIDYNVMLNFHEYLQKYKEANPDKFKLLGDVFKNSQALTKLKDIEDSEEPTKKNKAFEDIIKLAIEANEQDQNELYEKLRNITNEKKVLTNAYEKSTRDNTSLVENKKEVEGENKALLEANQKLIREKIKNKKMLYYGIPISVIILLLSLFRTQCYDAFSYAFSGDHINFLTLIKKSFLELLLSSQLLVIIISSVFSTIRIKEDTNIFIKYLNKLIKTFAIITSLYVIPLFIAFLATKFGT